MLEALRASNTWNATAVVTRYFGGILLGGGGLVRAYSTSVSEAVARAPDRLPRGARRFGDEPISWRRGAYRG